MRTPVRVGRAGRAVQDRVLARVRRADGSIAQIAADEGLPVDLVETMVDVWSRAGLVEAVPAVQACATCALVSGSRAAGGAVRPPAPGGPCARCPLAAIARR